MDQYVFRVDESLATADFVARYLLSPQFLELAPVAQTPGQLPRIRTAEVLSTPAPLPPLEVQVKLVDQLDVKRNALNRMLDAVMEEQRLAQHLGTRFLLATFAQIRQDAPLSDAVAS